MATSGGPDDWAKHWDTLCLGTVPIATAALGAVLVVAGFSEGSNCGIDDLTSPAKAIAAIFAGLAFVVYVVLATLAGVAIFVVRADNRVRTRLKLNLATTVYFLFILELFALGALLITNVIESPSQS